MVAMYLFRVLYSYLYIILHPSFWMNLYTVNVAFDKELLKLLNEGVMFTNIKSHSADFGPFTLWIENYPYAAFRLYNGSAIPKRYTRKLLMDRLVESQFKKGFKS